MITCFSNNFHLFNASESHHRIFHKSMKIGIIQIALNFDNRLQDVIKSYFVTSFTAHKLIVSLFLLRVGHISIIRQKKPNQPSS
jgi:hypothetical protein